MVETHIKIGASCALAAGILRLLSIAISSFLSPLQLDIFYDVIDILILIGLITIYFFNINHSGWIGQLGFCLALVGVGYLIGPNVTVFGANGYFLAAGLLSIGLAAMSVQFLRKKVFRRESILWLASTGSGILSLMPAVAILFHASAILFSAAFISAGLRIFRENRRVPTSSTS